MIAKSIIREYGSTFDYIVTIFTNKAGKILVQVENNVKEKEG